MATTERALKHMNEGNIIEGIDFRQPQIKFEGFTSKEHQEFVAEKLDIIGLPTDNIQKMRFINADSYIDAKRQWAIAGHFNFKTGEYALYKHWKEGMPEIAQMGTMVHELAHANSAFEEENDQMYGGRENRLKTLSHATAIAEQTLATGVYINSYHKMLAKMLENDEINEQRFIEETHAIMIETRFTNANHLKQVEDSQRIKLAILGKEYVSVTNGVNETLINLLSTDDLDTHIQSVRNSFMPQGQNQQTYQKAA